MKVIIVHKHERSLSLSVKSAEKQDCKVHLISEPSFALSLRKAFETAIGFKNKWFILLGGDQILKKGAIKTIKDNLSKNIFRVSGWGWDHLLMKERMMAPCVYNVSMLKEALAINFMNEVQPESYILKTMCARGHEKLILKNSLAIHDYCQYHSHIYEKGYFEASKFLHYFHNNHIIENLQDIAAYSIDHKIFLKGINDFINK